MRATAVLGILSLVAFGAHGLTDHGTELERFLAIASLSIAAAAIIARHEDDRTPLVRWRHTHHLVLVAAGLVIALFLMPVVAVLAGIVLLTFAALVYLLLPLFAAWSLDEDEHAW